MKVLVVGSGGREHTLAWSLVRSAQVQQVLCVPGNGGTALLSGCQNYPLGISDVQSFAAIADLAIAHAIDLVIVGPEVPLALGITDSLTAKGIPVFGPTQAGAQIEASKAWAKQLMADAHIPTAIAQVFTDAVSAKAYVTQAPIVVKADGLAAGKGVTVAMTLAEAHEAIDGAFGGKFGPAGQQVVIEEYLHGEEASVLALTDGHSVRPLLPAQDHKRIGEGDTGPNTGGMGAYAPAPVVTSALMERVQREILEPAIAQLRHRGIDYRGVLYAGLMITPEGDPKVIEFNCRFGDPEVQAVLPLLETPLEEVLLACVEQRLDSFPPLKWKSGAAACVVIAAQGYPGSYPSGEPITGLDHVEANGAIAFHAGTTLRDSHTLVTNGGRVMGITGVGENFDAALAIAYQGAETLQFSSKYYRRDIGYRVRSNEFVT